MKRYFLILTILIGGALLVGGSVLAQNPPLVLQLEVQEVGEEQRAKKGWSDRFSEFVGAKIIRPKEGTKFIVQSSAYASSPRQTDSTPCITAAGTVVRPGVVATNFLPLGTLLSINGKLAIVEDRMNRRYAGYFLDIWFPSTSEALVFGRKNIEIVVVGYGKPGQELTTNKTEAQAPSGLKRAQARFVALTKTLSAALLTKVNPSVNRWDVDCSNPNNVKRK